MTRHADNSQLSEHRLNRRIVPRAYCLGIIEYSLWLDTMGRGEGSTSTSEVREGDRAPYAAAGRHGCDTSERALIAYLLVPRPRDAVKALLAPVTYVVTAAAAGSFDRVERFVALWLTLEFLIYYARYQWNDARGVADDRKHPERGLRARLPAGATEEQARWRASVSLIAAWVRLLVAMLVGAALDAVEAVAILIVAVFSAAIAYEALRSRPPERLRRAAGPRELGIWTVVGVGYAVRGGLGIALADLSADGAAIGLGVAFFAAFGTMYVLLNWALEASSFCARLGDGWTVSEGLRGKPHLSALLRYLDGSLAGGPPFTTTRGAISRRAPGYLGDRKVLDGRGDLRCPWNIALIASTVPAALLGAELVAVERLSAKAMAVALCVAGALGLCRSAKSAVRWSLVGAVAIALAVLAVAMDAPAAWSLACPWLAAASCYAVFQSRSYLDSMGIRARKSAR